MENEENKSKIDLSLVLGYIAVKDLPSLEKKIAVLDQLGYDNKSMARICNTSDGVIKTLKSKIKKAN